MNTTFKSLAGGKSGILRLSLAAIALAINPVLVVVALLGLPVTPIFGTSYTAINSTTKTNLTDQTAEIAEEKWCRRIIEGADYQYQDNPFADGMMGDGASGKAIVQIDDFATLSGNTVKVTTYGGLGGPPVHGSTERAGQEQKFQVGSFNVLVNVRWFGVGYDALGRDQTMLGNQLGRLINDGLRHLHAKGRNDDIVFKLIEAAGTGGRNIIRPPGVATRNDLVSANVVSTPLIASAKNALTSLGALPMSMGAKDSGGSQASSYMYLSTQHALQSLDTEPAYLDAVTRAGERGASNPVFKGNYVEWNSTGIYRWNMIDHGNWGPIGSPLCPRAYLGVAITNATTGTEVKGGGNATAAAVTPAPKYFQYFSNAPYAYHDGTTIGADTSTDRYLMIINTDGTYGVFNYRVNDGNKITLYTSPQVSIGVGVETDDFAVGALIVECNAQGVPFGRSICFGREMIVAGRGSINGSAVNPRLGRKTTYEAPHGVSYAEGAEAVWGCAPVKRADNVYPGFVIVEHAIYVPGAPVIG